jgi:ABC-type molybdate transport system substrate-binding protein
MPRRLALATLIAATLAAPLRAEEVVVFAAASLKTALDEVAAAFQASTGHSVTIRYAGSGQLAKQIIEGALNDLVAKRGVYDYLVVCDSTNNTPDRIARNELYVDIAIEPMKDVEFIYIPIRLKNPGEIQADNIASASAVGTGA